MPTITFNAFSSLRKKLMEKNIECADAVMDIPTGFTTKDLLVQVGLDETGVETIFINGRVTTGDTVIEDGDRVAFVPSFMSGSDKTLQGLENIKKGIQGRS